MYQYLARRALTALLILVGIALVTFFLLYLMPADPARMIAGRSATPDTVARIRVELNLDKPFLERFGSYLGRLARGDLGRSYVQKTRVIELIGSRIGPTLQLMLGAILLELLIGLSIGIVSALLKNGLADKVLMIVTFVGISTPQFVLGMFLLLAFAIRLGIFPIGGYGTPAHLLLPALTLAISNSGWYARMMRSNLLEVLQQDYIRTARAKGASQARTLLRHALPNASLSIIAMIGIDIGVMMGGIVVVESVFGWPGVGQLAWQAIGMVDIPVIMGVTLLTAVAVVIANLLADLAVLFMDPRIKLS